MGGTGWIWLGWLGMDDQDEEDVGVARPVNSSSLFSMEWKPGKGEWQGLTKGIPSPLVQGAIVLHWLARLYEMMIQGATIAKSLLARRVVGLSIPLKAARNPVNLVVYQVLTKAQPVRPVRLGSLRQEPTWRPKKLGERFGFGIISSRLTGCSSANHQSWALTFGGYSHTFRL